MRDGNPQHPLLKLSVWAIRVRCVSASGSFSVVGDPGEMQNLVGKPDYESVLNEHRRLFKDWQRNTADTFEQRQSYAGTFLEV